MWLTLRYGGAEYFPVDSFACECTGYEKVLRLYATAWQTEYTFIAVGTSSFA